MNVFEKERKKLLQEDKIASQRLYSNVIEDIDVLKKEAILLTSNVMVKKAFKKTFKQVSEMMSEKNVSKRTAHSNEGYEIYKTLISQL